MTWFGTVLPRRTTGCRRCLRVRSCSKPMGLCRLARALGVPPQRVHDLVHGRRAVTADTALRLARVFSMEPQFRTCGAEVATDRLQARIDARSRRLA